MLYLDLLVGDRLIIDDGKIVVALEKSKGANKFKFGIEADKNIPVRVETAKTNLFAGGLSRKHGMA